MQDEALIREIQKGLLLWYDFKKDSTVLYIGRQEEALAEMFAELSLCVVCVEANLTCDEMWQQKYEEGFDYIVSIESLERQAVPEKFLSIWKRTLKKDGRMLLGFNNRFGIRYFCGDKDQYTERNFDGIENYRRAYSKKEDVFQGRCYNQSEIKDMLQNSGWYFSHFFSVISDLKNPTLIYSEDCLPKEDLVSRIIPAYHSPDTIFLEEVNLYDSLIKNGMFHKMANAYLVECSLNGEFSDVNHVTCSMERGKENAMLTIIRKANIVEKRAVYPEGRKRLEKLIEHGHDLAAHGISVVEAKLENGVYIMPYVEEEVAHVYLKKLLQTDKEKFLQEMDRFCGLILKSSEKVESDTIDEDNSQGVILRRGYIEMVPLNSFYKDGEFIFYDQEFCEENYPANMILTRVISTLYARNAELENILPINEMYERYGLMERLNQWRGMEWRFLAELRKEKELGLYHKKIWGNSGVINSNRQRLNYSVDDYDRLFVNIFRNADSRKLILFGSGNFAKKFLELYGRDYPVYAVIDNNQEKWGEELLGIPIQPPDMLRQLQSGEYKVLICIKNYLSVMKQLDSMGVREYSIYDSGKDYPRKRKPIVFGSEGDSSGTEAFALMGTETGRESTAQLVSHKKFHVGYIAGVFDLFHVGHLNMFKRAKEQCDYLIVGVVTDEGVREFKKTETFVPFEERIEMVRACRYVDEAVDIPLNYHNTRDAYRLLHFDCQFSGSDYVDDPHWLAEKEFLEEHGAEMVFFPYTEGTSSSKLKELIEKKLV